MKVKSFSDWIVAALYWPVVIAATAEVVGLPVWLLSNGPDRDLLWLAVKGQFGLAAILFVLALCDGETRRAVNRNNAIAHSERKSLPWWRHIFHRIGDRRLQICAFSLWCVVIITMFVRDEVYRTLAGSGFFVTLLMILLTLKYHLPDEDTQPV
ncbi:hypothetical protein ABAC460_16770 [Asticcacaulis sp. AC460]|uniref:hypothetical protein n=1 Tax=Asticcacaulis sp. AC460 TaxID=1282360 RepID=UPI0003C3F949|nr:hypothetical protein [Asticcacaulis sp. AC460]ESQ88313.1 hypothetical protein ABAC460_16770 [Asticcacaulis sp. AC460]